MLVYSESGCLNTARAEARGSFCVGDGCRVTTVRVPDWLARILAIAIIAGGVILGVLIFVPLAIMAGVAFLIYLGYLWVKIRIAKARSPNGSLDGRRNVRVINRDE